MTRVVSLFLPNLRSNGWFDGWNGPRRGRLSGPRLPLPSTTTRVPVRRRAAAVGGRVRVGREPVRST